VVKKYAPLLCLLVGSHVPAQKTDPHKPDPTPPAQIKGMRLSWHDEFNTNGRPDSSNWTYEHGYVRNRELQWYQPANAVVSNGVLLIEGRRENFPSPVYKEGSTDWRTSRPTVNYSAASLKTQGLQQFLFGRFEIRARIDTANGSWPAIWTLGSSGRWPLGGEIDIMEFYRVNEAPTILANFAWGRNDKGAPIWNTKKIPLTHFTDKDPQWPAKFHVWRMDWTKDSISLYLDDELLNTTAVANTTLNPDGSNPFLQPQYILLNLALGGNGGDPSSSRFPVKYEVDYVRHYLYE
jgi:beta-glucanase (GH16 family)